MMVLNFVLEFPLSLQVLLFEYFHDDTPFL